MTMYRKGIAPQSDLRIEIHLLSDGSLFLSPAYGFTPIFDHSADGVSGTFDGSGFSLEDKHEKVHYEWNTPYFYKIRPVLNAWLLQQKLEWPIEPETETKE